MKKNILLLCGGGGTEHDVSLVSSQAILTTLKQSALDWNVALVEIAKSGQWEYEKQAVELTFAKELVLSKSHKVILSPVDICIPCIHGYPGETGDIQSFLELLKIPYIGPGPEASKLCFNKISTKLWLDSVDVPTTPFIFVTDNSRNSLEKAQQFFEKHGEVFVKAASQGSSVGCYPANSLSTLESAITQAFRYSTSVLIEKKIVGREIELSVYDWKGEIKVSYPGEIICPTQFYSYDEKYSAKSKTSTEVKAPNLSLKQVELLQEYSKKAFIHLKLRHLSRIDFFVSESAIYLNEINTFPGLTPISMFPKMMEANGDRFSQFLEQIIISTLN